MHVHQNNINNANGSASIASMSASGTISTGKLFPGAPSSVMIGALKSSSASSSSLSSSSASASMMSNNLRVRDKLEAFKSYYETNL